MSIVSVIIFIVGCQVQVCFLSGTEVQAFVSWLFISSVHWRLRLMAGKAVIFVRQWLGGDDEVRRFLLAVHLVELVELRSIEAA